MKATRMMAAAFLLSAAASAAPAQLPGVSRADLLRRDLSAPGWETVQALVTFGPGASAPRHSHPGEELAYVVEGELEYQIDGEPWTRLKAGEALFIPAGAVHAARNVGRGEAKELATYIVEKDKPLIVLGE